MKSKRNKLIDARKEMEFTQEKVAEILGISRSFYNQIENGYRNPRHETSKKMVLLFGLDINNWE